MQTYEIILISLSAGQFLAMIIGGYIFLQKPAVAARKEADTASDKVNIMQSSCLLKHNRIDEIFATFLKKFDSIDNSLLLIKENDIKHIEQEMRRMSDVQTEILAILRYKEGIEVGK